MIVLGVLALVAIVLAFWLGAFGMKASLEDKPTGYVVHVATRLREDLRAEVSTEDFVALHASHPRTATALIVLARAVDDLPKRGQS